MERFKEFIRWFIYITTCILFVVAINVWLSGDETVPASTLWKILLSGFFTALVTVFLGPKEKENERVSVLRIFVHYVILCVIMILCGYQFGWMSLRLEGILMMVVSVAVVYLLVFFAGYWMNRKQADEINEKLKGKYSDKEEKE